MKPLHRHTLLMGSLLLGLSFALFYTVCGIPIGRLADVRSRRGIIATGMVFWSLMTAGCGLALYALCVWPANFNHMALDMARADHGASLDDGRRVDAGLGRDGHGLRPSADRTWPRRWPRRPIRHSPWRGLRISRPCHHRAPRRHAIPSHRPARPCGGTSRRRRP